ncbi:Symplekin tight junction protein C terminal-domain-containing protein [Pisolithus orientalis]|uniref:Symplekin tight junction protein C terminal-domain-containing protein n=1 Tax=Pisolithus orientalis TaxID=936130 RepID=UPI002224CE8B|nr:Symplekin tight junction protein C terminal-domain-containing protein [Pisolithus orientalis]KAI5992594.1 Symplekin tight junction protein C terminal-domain-containing protein [Pisolithus orientalis]
MTLITVPEVNIEVSALVIQADISGITSDALRTPLDFNDVDALCISGSNVTLHCATWTGYSTAIDNANLTTERGLESDTEMKSRSPTVAIQIHGPWVQAGQMLLNTLQSCSVFALALTDVWQTHWGRPVQPSKPVRIGCALNAIAARGLPPRGTRHPLVKRRVADLLHIANVGLLVSAVVRTQLASRSVSRLAKLLNNPSVRIVKVVTQCLTIAYALLICTLVRVLLFPPGIGTKLMQIEQLQNKNDPNIAIVPVDHSFISASALEAEVMKLLENMLMVVYSSQEPDILTAIVNNCNILIKQRPSSVHLIVSSLVSWTPVSLAGLPASVIRGVEKSIRILPVHISRDPHSSAFGAQINKAFAIQVERIERASAEEKAPRAAIAAAATETTRKRPPSSISAEEKKDPKCPTAEVDSGAANSAVFLAAFNSTTLPVRLVTDLIVANLQAFSKSALMNLVQSYRQSRGLPSVPPAKPPRPPDSVARTEGGSVDPLKMDIDEEEMEYEPDKLNLEISAEEAAAYKDIPDDCPLDLLDFKLPSPKDLSADERVALMRSATTRIWDSAEDIRRTTSMCSSQTSSDMWMVLIVPVTTRAVILPGASESPKDDAESSDATDTTNGVTLCEYIMNDFPSRLHLAITWMNEEWHNDRIRSAADPDCRPNYQSWLNQIISTYQTVLEGNADEKPDSKDKAFSRFSLDLPDVPSDIWDILRDLSVNDARGLRDAPRLVLERPLLRAEALHALLDLTTHPDSVARRATINMVRRNDCLKKAKALMVKCEAEVDNMEDGQLPPEELIQTPYLIDEIQLPAEKSHVLQHVELLFALSVKIPEFWDRIVVSYSQMDVTVQEAIQDLIMALIKSLGWGNGKLLTLMRTCPAGSESLALRVLTIFMEHGRPSAQLVALVKGLISERGPDAHFLIPIVAEMDKVDIMRHLPRIVSTLDGQPEPKNLVRLVFSSIVTTPPQTFGSATSSLLRARQSELLTPAELTVLMHEAEKEIGLMSAIEAIGICFSMTDIFRSEILAVVMQQIVDEPVLPVLFLRTSLIPFVSTSLLSWLITKETGKTLTCGRVSFVVLKRSLQLVLGHCSSFLKNNCVSYWTSSRI